MNFILVVKNTMEISDRAVDNLPLLSKESRNKLDSINKIKRRFHLILI